MIVLIETGKRVALSSFSVLTTGSGGELLFIRVSQGSCLSFLQVSVNEAKQTVAAMTSFDPTLMSDCARPRLRVSSHAANPV